MSLIKKYSPHLKSSECYKVPSLTNSNWAEVSGDNAGRANAEVASLDEEVRREHAWIEDATPVVPSVAKVDRPCVDVAAPVPERRDEQVVVIVPELCSHTADARVADQVGNEWYHLLVGQDGGSRDVEVDKAWQDTTKNGATSVVCWEAVPVVVQVHVDAITRVNSSSCSSNHQMWLWCP